MKRLLQTSLKSVAGVALGLGLGLIVCHFAGESPWKVLKILFQSSFGSGYDFGMTLFYTAPLLMTGLAVSIPIRAGLFNVGGEGQLLMGAMAAAFAGVWGKNIASPALAMGFATVLAFLGGGIWGAIPGVLKAKRGSHEVAIGVSFETLRGIQRCADGRDHFRVDRFDPGGSLLALEQRTRLRVEGGG